MKLGLISDTHGNLQGWERAWVMVVVLPPETKTRPHSGQVAV